MRLINTETLELEDFPGDALPHYAILSHTWGADEVTHAEWRQRDRATRRKAGFAKVARFCRLAQELDLRYLWADTACIDKASSAELSEAINSMFRWYGAARVCLVHLEDVLAPGEEQRDGDAPATTPEQRRGRFERQFRGCRWFTRGWTLQELVAPRDVVFYSGHGTRIAPLADLLGLTSQATGIPAEALSHQRDLGDFSVAQRMSWAAPRATTRPEDVAYCLLGIFDINMPLLYGEGPKAFRRLQEDIIRTSDDHSILASEGPDFLASSPRRFRHGSTALRTPSILQTRDHYAMTNAGIHITLPVLKIGADGYLLALLNCQPTGSPPDTFLGLVILGDDTLGYHRAGLFDRPVPITLESGQRRLPRKTVYLVTRPGFRARALDSGDDDSGGAESSFMKYAYVESATAMIPPTPHAVVVYDGDEWTDRPADDAHRLGGWVTDAGWDGPARTLPLRSLYSRPDLFFAGVALYPTRGGGRPVYTLIGYVPIRGGTGRDWFCTRLDHPSLAQDGLLAVLDTMAECPSAERGIGTNITFPTWSTRSNSVLAGVPMVQIPPTGIYKGSQERMLD